MEAGIKIMLYKRRTDDSPGTLHPSMWNTNTRDAGKLNPQQLCLTTRVVHFHAPRVYLQIQRWQELKSQYLDVRDYGFCDTLD